MNHGHLLHSVDLKIERAEHHLKRLHEMGKQLTAKKPYSADPEPDPGIPKRTNYRAKVKEQPPDTYRTVVGDCVHNLRASLDNLAHALAMRHTGEPLPFEHKIAFPIKNRRGEFPSISNAGQVLGAMPPRARTLIETLQPYHRRNDPQNHPLARLRDLDDFDKHRVLHIVNAVPTSAKFEFSVPLKGAVSDITHGPLEDDAIVGWVDMTNAIPFAPGAGPKVKVEVKASFGTGIAFDRAGPGQGDGVTYLIEEELLPYVKDVVLPKFTRFFV